MAYSDYIPCPYKDPTAEAAIGNVMRENRGKAKKFRSRVFICSPYAGNTKRNIENARKYCRFAIEKGYDPFAPHLFYPQFLRDNNTCERDIGLNCGLRMLDECREVWVFGERISPGMQKEIERARKKKIPIEYFTVDCKKMHDGVIPF